LNGEEERRYRHMVLEKGGVGDEMAFLTDYHVDCQVLMPSMKTWASLEKCTSIESMLNTARWSP